MNFLKEIGVTLEQINSADYKERNAAYEAIRKSPYSGERVVFMTKQPVRGGVLFAGIRYPNAINQQLTAEKYMSSTYRYVWTFVGFYKDFDLKTKPNLVGIRSVGQPTEKIKVASLEGKNESPILAAEVTEVVVEESGIESKEVPVLEERPENVDGLTISRKKK